jgi:hypothetical protein
MEHGVRDAMKIYEEMDEFIEVGNALGGKISSALHPRYVASPSSQDRKAAAECYIKVVAIAERYFNFDKDSYKHTIADLYMRIGYMYSMIHELEFLEKSKPFFDKARAILSTMDKTPRTIMHMDGVHTMQRDVIDLMKQLDDMVQTTNENIEIAKRRAALSPGELAFVLACLPAHMR